MKAWFNEKGNWCFEFEREEKETERLIMLIGEGTNWWKVHRDKSPASFISANLFDYALRVIFVGQNYYQSHPTISDPIVVKAEKLIAGILETYEKLKWSSVHFNEVEMELLRTKSIEELL